MITRRLMLGSTAAALASSAIAAPNRRLSAGQVAALGGLDALFEPLAGGALGVFVDGDIAFAKAYGFADRQNGIAATPETNFRLASVSKGFTAMAVLMQVARGKARLDTRLGDVFPEAPAHRAAITLEQLLRHTAGLPDYEKLAPPGLALPMTDLDVLRVIFASDAKMFEPGTAWSYSNSAYAILAKVVEQLSGKRYDLFLRDEIFRPLGMSGSLAYVPGTVPVPRRAYGQKRVDLGWERFDQSLFSSVLGDGGVYSSIVDMAKWDKALRRNLLLPPPLYAEMYRITQLPRAPDAAGPRDAFGMGWMIDPANGRRYHTGSSMGFRTMIDRHAEGGITVVVLSNDSAADNRAINAAATKALGSA